MLNLTSAKLTGNPGPTGWSQVHEFKPEDPAKLALRGHLFAVVATGKAMEGVDVVTSGRELLARLHEEYFGKTEGTSFNMLKSAVQKVLDEFGSLWGSIEVAAVVSSKDALYTVVGGGSQAAILRNGMYAKILVSGKGEVVAASGYPKENDVLIIGSKTFFVNFTDGVIKAALEAESPEAAIEQMAPSVHTKSDEGTIGVVIMKFSQESAFFQSEAIAPQTSEEKKAVDEGRTIKMGGSSLSSTLKEKFKSLTLANFKKRSFYLRKDSGDEAVSQKRKVTFTVGVILLVLLFLSIGFGMKQKNVRDKARNYEGRIFEAQSKINDAVNLMEADPAQARLLFSEGASITESLRAEGIKDKQLDEVVALLNEKKAAVLGEYEVEAQDFLDLSLLSSGFVGDSLSSSEDKFFILDKNGKKIVSSVISTKKTQVVAGPDQLEGVLNFSSYEDRVFVMKADGIYEVGDELKKVIEKDWGEALFASYAGNIYLLDKTEGMIYRYVGSGKEFSTKQKWLGADVAPDFSKIATMTIDGTIWVLSESGKIAKFSLGSPQAIGSLVVYPPLTTLTSIYTNGEAKYVYLLDNQIGRIIVLAKNGVYKAQYYSDKAKGASALIVSESEKKLILLSGAKLYSIELKHL